MENLSFKLNDTDLTVHSIPAFIDYTARALCLFIHIGYFFIVAFSKDLKKIPLIPMHHTNLIGLLTAIHYCIWITWNEPDTGNNTINNVLCHTSETFWALTKFSRSFSILILAIYRLVAVFRVTLFKKIVENLKLYLATVFLVWFVSAIVFLIAKFSSHTLPGLIFCYDGYSPNSQESIIYYIITSIFAYLLPASLVIVSYVCIRIKLKSLDSRLDDHKNNQESLDNSKNTLTMNTTGNDSQITNKNMTKKKKENGLAKQLVVINVFEMASCVFFVLISSSNVITSFSTQYYFARQLFRIGNLICQMSIPIVSLIYSPAFKKTLKLIKSRVV